MDEVGRVRIKFRDLQETFLKCQNGLSGTDRVTIGHLEVLSDSCGDDMMLMIDSNNDDDISGLEVTSNASGSNSILIQQ
ncbi:hypothetical protein RJT34_13152 [Clitoria ternatea]|uniref:Uncharacterized protein n=1 Tax=Clitoria ternatea TaxID=43366 RepID=A0AAN9PM19_CLITE